MIGEILYDSSTIWDLTQGNVTSFDTKAVITYIEWLGFQFYASD